MAWIQITEADVLTVLSAPELEGYREAALADAQPDPVQPSIDQVVDEVRGYVAGCAKNTLGPAGTIPQKLLAASLDLLAVRIPKRVGKNPKEVRAEAAKEAKKLLELVAACKFAVEEPETPDTEEQTAPSPSFSGRPRRNVRNDSQGL